MPSRQHEKNSSMNVIKPPRLSVGDTIGLVAPASSMSVISKRFIDNGVRKLEELGFTVKVAKHALGKYRKTSGTAQERTTDIMDMFADSKVKAIMCVIGGYNSNDVLDRLDYGFIAQHPKVFIGFSDSTAINTALLVKSGLVNFSGPSFVTFCPKEVSIYTLGSFRSVLMDSASGFSIAASPTFAEDEWFLTELGNRVWKPNRGIQKLGSGTGKGRAIGGNLDTFLALSGTEYFPNLRGKILFLESATTSDLRETTRGLTQLRLMGALEKISGLVLGRFSSKAEDSEPNGIQGMLADALGSHHLPVLYNVDFGHTDPIITLPIGVECEVDADHGNLRIVENAVI